VESRWLRFIGTAIKTVVDAATEDRASGETFWSRLGTRVEKRLEEVARSKDPFLLSARASKMEYSQEIGDWKLVVSIVEGEIELDYSDFFVPERMEEKIRLWWNGLAPIPATRIFMAYLRSLTRAERQVDQVALIEALFGLRWNDYHTADRFRVKLWEGIEKIATEVPAARASIVFLLTTGLLATGRVTESVVVLETLSGLGNTTPSSFEQNLVSAFDGSIGSAVSFLEDVGARSNQLRKLALEAIERIAGIVSADYRDRSRLREKLRSLDKTLDERMLFGADRIEVFRALCLSLLRDGRSADALAVVAAELLPPTESIPLFVSRLRWRLRLSPLDLSARHFQAVALVLRAALAPETAATILESVLTADKTGDWSDPWSLGFAIREYWGRDVATAFYVLQTAEALVAAGRKEKAEFLVDAYVTVTRLGEEEIPVVLAQSCPIYDLWLCFQSREARDAPRFHFQDPLMVCRDLVPRLRKMLAEGGTTLKDREGLIRSVARLRRRIIETGLFWAEREADLEKVRHMRYEVLLWDLELAQQALIERFLLTEIRHVAATGPPPAGRWPWREGEGEQSPKTKDYLPPVDEPEALAGVLGQVDAAVLASIEAMPGGQTARGFRQYQRLGIFARRGVDEAALAASLGPGGVMLRATFDPNGRLVWSALTSDGVRLELSAHSSGSPGDLNRLRWAAARHDFRIGYAHWCQEFKPFLGVYSPQDLLTALRGNKLPDAAEPVRDSFARLSRLLTWLGPEPASPPAAEALRFAEDLILNPCESPLWRKLDRATSAFLEEVEGIWNLGPLVPTLSPDTNLVIQVDDALHAVPMAWLPVGGRPLFRSVRSIRASLTPTLDLLMADLEREARESGSRPRQMLSVSSFAPNDPARSGGRWLHHGQLRLADAHGYECLAGADREGGTVGAIRGALDQYGRFETTAICGHGNFERAGIVLSTPAGGQELWQGDGCDLGGIEWLLLVSCSIGRAAQTGELDVEGFCVQLAAHRARAVAACRWPVLSVQAAAFANETVNQYLKLIEKEPRGAALRARALNLARQRFSEEDSDRPLVGLNTAAAFELYGLG